MYIISVGYHDIYVYYHIMIYIYVYYDGLRSSGDVINGGSWYPTEDYAHVSSHIQDIQG
jgi:hypothetical protein